MRVQQTEKFTAHKTALGEGGTGMLKHWISKTQADTFNLFSQVLHSTEREREREREEPPVIPTCPGGWLQ